MSVQIIRRAFPETPQKTFWERVLPWRTARYAAELARAKKDADEGQALLWDRKGPRWTTRKSRWAEFYRPELMQLRGIRKQWETEYDPSLDSLVAARIALERLTAQGESRDR